MGASQLAPASLRDHNVRTWTFAVFHSVELVSMVSWFRAQGVCVLTDNGSGRVATLAEITLRMVSRWIESLRLRKLCLERLDVPCFRDHHVRIGTDVVFHLVDFVS